MTIRWGIVTAGKISNDFVNAFNTYPHLGDQTIVGIAARDKTKAADFAKTHGIPKVFDSYEALAKSKDIGMFIVHRNLIILIVTILPEPNCYMPIARIFAVNKL